jgi:catalase (peroxidase I)
MTQELRLLLAQSAIPLIAVEKACAVDSTGLRTTRFNYYRKEKYEPQRETIWPKMHGLAGWKPMSSPSSR